MPRLRHPASPPNPRIPSLRMRSRPIPRRPQRTRARGQVRGPIPRRPQRTRGAAEQRQDEQQHRDHRPSPPEPSRRHRPHDAMPLGRVVERFESVEAAGVRHWLGIVRLVAASRPARSSAATAFQLNASSRRSDIGRRRAASTPLIWRSRGRGLRTNRRHQRPSLPHQGPPTTVAAFTRNNNLGSQHAKAGKPARKYRHPAELRSLIFQNLRYPPPSPVA
jgi:hypothetical protein